MLAKVIKNQNVPAAVTAVAIPRIGGSSTDSRSIGQFVFPSVAELLAGETEQPAAVPETEPVETEFEPAVVMPNIDEIVQSARDEAARIIATAESNAADIAEAAREKAEQEVRLRFDQEVAAQAAEIRLQLTETIEQIAGLAAEITRQAENDLVELALRIAKKVVAREVTIDREIALTLVKVSLGKLHNRSVAEVHLNPEDLQFVRMHREKLDFRGSLELVEDRSISVGGCLIHTETGDIDARIESQFEEIAHGLFN
ncbi:MAG: hypothetical protein JSS81_00975 [Acidobacteria bacterium]|nr:hypothetical protein [Acidobacteriota bacterium]